MKSLDEKKLLAKMARNIGQPDIALEESIRREEKLAKKIFREQKEQSPPVPILVEDKSFIQEVAPPPTPPAAEPMGVLPNPPKIAVDLHKAELNGIHKQIDNINQRIGTLAFGGGGTGIVRLQEADDIVRVSLANNIALKYVNGVFVGTRELPTGNLIVANTISSGIKVDIDNPTYGWRDIIGSVQPKATGVGSPTRRIYFTGGNYGDYSFVLNDVTDFIFHIPHDYVPGSNLYFHVHWSHTGTTVSGNAVFTTYHTYSKGHNQENFTAEKTNVLDVPTPDVATVPQYRHRIDEFQITTPGGSTPMTDSNRIEVDGLLGITIKLTGIPTIGGGGYLFIHTCDLHYQSTNMATKGKAPNFYTGTP